MVHPACIRYAEGHMKAQKPSLTLSAAKRPARSRTMLKKAEGDLARVTDAALGELRGVCEDAGSGVAAVARALAAQTEALVAEMRLPPSRRR